MIFQSVRSAVALPAAIAIVMASQPIVLAADSSVGLARYDAARKAVVIPYAGTFPTFLTDGLSGPPRVYFDFDASSNIVGVPSGNVYGHPSMVKWTMAKKAGGKVRLVLNFNKATKVLVLNDASRRQILLIPQASSASSTPSVAVVPAATPKPAAAGPRTFRQTVGSTNFKYTVGPRPKKATRDQVFVNVESNGVSDFRVQSDPAKNFVAFSISMNGEPPARPAAKPTAKPTPKPTPRPTATPTPEPWPTPEPLPTEEPTPEPLPIPTEDPTPEPLPSAIIIEPSPSPDPVSAEPGTILTFKGNFPETIVESQTITANAVETGSEFTAESASLEGADFEQRFLGNWAYLLGIEHTRFRVTDAQTNNTTAHDRDEYEASTGFGYRFTPWGTEEMIGIGYMARYLSVANVAVGDATTGAADTAIPGPATDSVLTAASQLYHGPTVFGRVDLPIFGPLGLEVKGGAAPFLMGALSPAAEAVAPLIGYWGTPSLYLRFGLVQLTAGYSLSMLQGTSYSYMRSGPQVRLDWRF